MKICKFLITPFFSFLPLTYSLDTEEEGWTDLISETYLENNQLDGNHNLAIAAVRRVCSAWFGSFVTPTWWNGAWLSFSFCEFLTYYSLSKISLSSMPDLPIEAWILFHGRKASGYAVDLTELTHPVSFKVPNTKAAKQL